MQWLASIKNILEEGQNLGGEVGSFYQFYTPYIIGTLLFIALLYALRKAPLFKAIHNFAKLESRAEREESEFIRMFQSPKTRIAINSTILLGIIFLMLVYAFLIFTTVSIPFIAWKNDIPTSQFSLLILCITLLFAEFWALWLLMRFKEQTARAIRLDRTV